LSAGIDLSPLKTVRAAWADGLRWLVRARGHGTLVFTNGTTSTAIDLDSNGWSWKEVPVSRFAGMGDVTLTVGCENGSVDLDTALLTAGPWKTLLPGDSIDIPASGLFHSGSSHPENGSVVFTPEYNGPGLVLNGPRLPVEPGRYRIRVDIASPSPAGTELGTFMLRHEGGPDLREFPAVAASANTIVQVISDNRPLVLALVYKGETECEVVRVVLERVQ
jgi:hypothetical protein